MNHSSVNRFVACKPPVRTSVEPTVKSGFATVKQKAALVPMEVVFSYKRTTETDTFYGQAGWTVHVLGDHLKAVWATTVYELDGVQFVLVPIDSVRLVSA